MRDRQKQSAQSADNDSDQTQHISTNFKSTVRKILKLLHNLARFLKQQFAFPLISSHYLEMWKSQQVRSPFYSVLTKPGNVSATQFPCQNLL